MLQLSYNKLQLIPMSFPFALNPIFSTTDGTQTCFYFHWQQLMVKEPYWQCPCKSGANFITSDNSFFWVISGNYSLIRKFKKSISYTMWKKRPCRYILYHSTFLGCCYYERQYMSLVWLEVFRLALLSPCSHLLSSQGCFGQTPENFYHSYGLASI